jgi:hypothetical protein
MVRIVPMVRSRLLSMTAIVALLLGASVRAEDDAKPKADIPAPDAAPAQEG